MHKHWERLMGKRLLKWPLPQSPRDMFSIVLPPWACTGPVSKMGSRVLVFDFELKTEECRSWSPDSRFNDGGNQDLWLTLDDVPRESLEENSWPNIEQIAVLWTAYESHRVGNQRNHLNLRTMCSQPLGRAWELPSHNGKRTNVVEEDFALHEDWFPCPAHWFQTPEH